MNRKTLLIVDDEPAVRRAMRRRLERGYRILEAEDGPAALAALDREKPDLVLLDLHLPRLDGVEALSEMLEARAGLPVIMVTGDQDEDRAKLAMERGACDYVTKPIDWDYLELSIAANLLGRAGAGRPR
jgi:DNA-binding NtrC family response regulator